MATRWEADFGGLIMDDQLFPVSFLFLNCRFILKLQIVGII